MNADHIHSLAKSEEAARAGFDAVVFDGSTLPFDKKVTETKRAVQALKSINPKIILEEEIGSIGSGSEIHDSAPAAAKILRTPEEARQFVAGQESTSGRQPSAYARAAVGHATRRSSLFDRPDKIVPHKILPTAVDQSR